MIIIIGAGLIGLSIGNELLDYGYEVNIFDFKKKGEASGAAVGMLAPLIEAKPYEEELFQLMQESKSIWFNHSRDLEKQSDLVTGYIENSALLIAKDSDEFEKLKFKQNFIKKIGHDTKLLDKSQTLEIEPLLSENIYASLYCEEQSQVNPILLKKALANSFLKKGGSVFGKKSVNKLVLKNNKVGVSLRNEVSFASKVIRYQNDRTLKGFLPLNAKSFFILLRFKFKFFFDVISEVLCPSFTKASHIFIT